MPCPQYNFLCVTQKLPFFAKSAKNAKIEKTLVLQPQYEQVGQL
jgi:hypothetical protein